MRIKKRRIIGYAYRTSQEKELQVLKDFYSLDFTQLLKNSDTLDADIKLSRNAGTFPKNAKARKFRLVLEEVE